MIERDNERAEKKRQELKQTMTEELESSFGTVDDSVLEEMVEESVRVQSPEVDRSIHLMVADKSGGRSLKAGNIWFKPTKILNLAASGSLTVGSAIGMPVLAPAAAIVLWTSILSGVSENVTTEEAFVYWTIWKYADEDGLTPANSLMSLLEEEMDDVQLNIVLGESDIEKAVAKLDRIDAVQILEREGTEYYHARERCRVSWR